MTSNVTYTRGVGGYSFSADEIAKLTSISYQLLADLGSPTKSTEIGLGGLAYEAILGMISFKVNGEWVRKPGVDESVWTWVNGASKVNAASGHFAEFIDGGADNDVLIGDIGNDGLNGWLGEDIILGGAGDDNGNWGHVLPFTCGFGQKTRPDLKFSTDVIYGLSTDSLTYPTRADFAPSVTVRAFLVPARSPDQRLCRGRDRHRAVREVIRHRGNGLLLSFFDGNQIVAAVQKVLADPIGMQAMRKAMMDSVRGRTVPAIVKAHKAADNPTQWRSAA